MTIIDKLATSLNRRDEVPNQELAKQVAAANDKKAVSELFQHLTDKTKGIVNDCIKVIYEIGVLKPKLIAGYIDEIVALFESKNNRLQWGAMTALNSITGENAKAVYAVLPKVIAAADKGSVITNDHCVDILVKLYSIKEYADKIFPLLNERLRICPTNQLGMYSEKALPVITAKNKPAFISTLASRLREIEKDSMRLRVEKVIKKAKE